MRYLEGFAKFISDQLFSSLDDFIQRNGDELFQRRGEQENTNVCLSIQLAPN